MKSPSNSQRKAVAVKRKLLSLSERISRRPLRNPGDLLRFKLLDFASLDPHSRIHTRPDSRARLCRARRRFRSALFLWTLFVAFLYSAYAMFTWPFRHLLRTLKRRKAYGNAKIKRAVILGFDGMDPELTERFIAEGRLPNSG